MTKSIVDKLAIMGMLAAMEPTLLHFPEKKDDGTKNKFNLTPEEIEKMSEMSPKEKKKFLKDRNE